MSLSKAEMKSLYKSVVKEIISEEKENDRKIEQEKIEKYMEIINELSIYQLLDSDIDFENTDEEAEGHITLKLWNFPENIQDHLKEKFKDDLEALNRHFIILMEPVKEFVDGLRNSLVHKELDEFNLNKEIREYFKNLVKKQKKVA